MDEDTALKYADIKQDGSVLLGEHTVCDGANHGRSIAVFTHIHKDHTRLFDSAVQTCHQIYVSPPTFDMLAVLEQEFTQDLSPQCYFRGRHVEPLDYETPRRPALDPMAEECGYGDKITLYPSHHMLGSAQVLVETTSGMRIVYTGDFGTGASPIPCDILVMDSTHGSPMFGAPADTPSLERRLADYVDEEIQNGKNILIRSHRGRLQYTMHLLDKKLPGSVKFLAHKKDIGLASVYRKYGMDIRDCMDYNDIEGQDVYEHGALYVEFRTHGSAKNVQEGTERMMVFNLGGRFLGGGTTIKKNGDYHMEFMDHADYAAITEYVRKSSPEYVVTDYARGRQGKKLAEAIQDMGIGAVARPIG